MAGMQFEYDEQGGTFYYFLLSFIALILIPATYYLWPRKTTKDEARRKYQCRCEPCQLKRQLVRASQPWKNFQHRALKFVLLCGWAVFVFVAYKASKVELDFKEFDPYAELGIDRGADVSEIKKAYRKLSLIYHPDRDTGDSNKFMYITKAYDALTDEESRKNWEEYGNPDGPGATQVGIALPKWIIEKQNSIWVLGLYALIFMIILPLCVGMWWYHSIKYSAQQVLIDTTKLYQYFLGKSPNMIAKKVIQVLAASHEFCKRFNKEIVERPSDNVEIPELIRNLPGFNQNSQYQNRDLFSRPYCLKIRALLESHFSRKELPPKTLELDRQYMLKKCPYLLNELLNQATFMFYHAQANPQMNWKLSLDTVENIMKTSQSIIQGIWSHKSPFLQLPHITEDNLRHFVTKRRNIRTLKQFVSLKEEERKALLRSLNDDQYRDVILVCSQMPQVDMSFCCEVKGEDDQTISASSLVTLTVTLTRRSLMPTSDMDFDISGIGGGGGAFEDEDISNIGTADGHVEDGEEEEDIDAVAHSKTSGAAAATAAAPKWMKNKKKKGGAAKKTKKPAPTKAATSTKKQPIAAGVALAIEDKKETANHSTEESGSSRTLSKLPNGDTDHRVGDDHSTNEEDEEVGGGAEEESAGEGEDSEGDGHHAVTNHEEGEDPDDEEQWRAFQQESKNEGLLETKSKETHLVHCPHFPVEKYEWWWLYLADTKKKQLITAPILVTTLKDIEKKELRFQAPPKPGNYQYTVVLRSDSYLGIDQLHPVKLDVKEAKKAIESHPQWENVTDDEEEKKDEQESETGSSDSASDDDD